MCKTLKQHWSYWRWVMLLLHKQQQNSNSTRFSLAAHHWHIGHLWLFYKWNDHLKTTFLYFDGLFSTNIKVSLLIWTIWNQDKYSHSTVLDLIPTTEPDPQHVSYLLQVVLCVELSDLLTLHHHFHWPVGYGGACSVPVWQFQPFSLTHGQLHLSSPNNIPMS